MRAVRVAMLLLTTNPDHGKGSNRNLLARPHGVADGAVPFDIALRAIPRAELVPVLARDAVEIPDYLAGANGQLADQLLVAAHPRAIHVHEAEIAVLEPKHRDVRR